MVSREVLAQFEAITEEEREILNGKGTIDRAIYMQGRENTVNARKLLSAGKLISLRRHTRFIAFPEHTHDYVELVYMCTGETVHVVNGAEITLKAGELLFLNQRATHEVRRCGERDIAVNFIVLPDFFSGSLDVLDEETPLKRFLVDCICGQSSGNGYLHFRVSESVAVQNLVENLLITLTRETPYRRMTSQMTMTLLFVQLLGLTEHLETEAAEDALLVQLLSYVESRYADGSLSEAADLLHCDFYWLSREIKRKTGKTYTQLVQARRLSQAGFLLKSTDRNVDEIARAVGYENIGYFHRIFRAEYGLSPREYRVQIR